MVLIAAPPARRGSRTSFYLQKDMEGLRPRAGKGEVPEDPGPARAVSPTFRADARPERSHHRNPLVQAG